MYPDCFIFKDKTFFHIHKWIQAEYTTCNLFVLPLGKKPVLLYGEIVYAVFYGYPEQGANSDEHHSIKALIEHIFSQVPKVASQLLKDLLYLLPDSFNILTEKGYRSRRCLRIGNIAPFDGPLIFGKSNEYMRAAVRIADKCLTKNNCSYSDALKWAISTEILGEHYHVDQPKWYTEAVTHWGAKGNKTDTKSE